MTDEFLRFSRALPEPLILVSPEGRVLGANPSAGQLLSLGQRPDPTRLETMLADSPERLQEFLRACSRTGSLVPGALALRLADGRTVRFRCEGAALRPDNPQDEPRLILRFRPHHEASHRFLILNQKIDQLGREILERRSVEAELQAQALHLEETAVELEATMGELEEQTQRAQEAQATAERGAAELAQMVKRLEVLAGAGEILSSNLDYQSTLVDLARLCTESVADYCVTYLRDEDGPIRRVGVSHADPSKFELVEQLLRLAPISIDEETGAGRVVRTGESLFAPEISEEMLVAGAQSHEHLEIIRQLAPRSSIIVPLEARGRTIGAIAVATVEGGKPPYADVDVTFLEEIAHRAALSVDNLHLLHVAQEANRAKADFLAVMSHELRTPLNAIIGYVDLLDAEVRGPVTEGQREQLHRILRSAHHLIGIIGEILDFARLEAGREVVRREPADLRVAANEAAEAIEPVAHRRGLRFVLDLPPNPVSTMTDSSKVKQILLNLLSNAVKFTDRGEVGLRLGLNGSEAIFRVHDSGVGIAPEDAANIFEPFWQVQRGPTRQSGGTGLGLTVSRRLALLLGGDIALESQPGQGTRFDFRIPLAPPGSPSDD